MLTTAVAGRLALVGCALSLAAFVALSGSNPAAAVAGALLAASLVMFGREQSAVGSMMLAAFTAPMNALGAAGAAGSVTVADALLLLGFIALGPSLVRKRLNLPFVFAIGAVGLTVLGIVSSMASDAPAESVVVMVRLLVAALIIPTVILWWGPSMATIHRLAFAYVAGALTSIAYAVAVPNIGYRAFGLTTHVNNFGLTSLLALWLLPFIHSRLRGPARLVTWPAALACLWGILESGSRAALLVTILLAIGFPLLERSRRAAWAALWAAPFALLFSGRLLTTDGDNALARLLGGDYSGNSDRERASVFSEGAAAFLDAPFIGRGFAGVQELHSVYLSVAVAAGLFGLLSMLVVLWPTARAVVQGRRPGAMIAYAPLAYIMFAALSTNLWDRFVWIVLALSLAAEEANRKEAGDLEREPDPDHGGVVRR